MLRHTVLKASSLSCGRLGIHTSPKLQQELIELFIDDKPVQVPPGTTVLQVGFCILFTIYFIGCYINCNDKLYLYL